MDIKTLKNMICKIVTGANDLKNTYTDEVNALVNYACIFAQTQKEYDDMIKIMHQFGTIVQETANWPLFRISPLTTIAWHLVLCKIRIHDITRPERGDADFTVSDYDAFKNKYLQQECFTLISREKFEMIELYDPSANYRAYFSNIPLTTQLGVV